MSSGRAILKFHIKFCFVEFMFCQIHVLQKKTWGSLGGSQTKFRYFTNYVLVSVKEHFLSSDPLMETFWFVIDSVHILKTAEVMVTSAVQRVIVLYDDK